jgi:hypothetical protein
VRVGHESVRTGALQLLAGVALRRGTVDAPTAERTRQVAWLACWEHVDRETAPPLTTMPVVRDHGRRHKGQPGPGWLSQHPRFRCHVPPVQGSRMHQVEPWCASVPRQRRRRTDVADPQHRAHRGMAFVAEWKAQAHPLPWSTTSVANVMGTCESQRPRPYDYPPFMGTYAWTRVRNATAPLC